MKVRLKRLSDKATLPEHGSDGAAGYDLRGTNDSEIVIQPHSTVLIGTGWAMATYPEWWIGIYPRSGLSTKRDLRLANCTAVIDTADYRGEVMVPLHNDSDHPRAIAPHEKIAQMVAHKRYNIEFYEVEELDETKRGTGGFGSTGR